MQTRTKISVFMLVAVFFYLGFLYSLKNFNDDQLKVVLEEKTVEETKRLDDLVYLIASPQRDVTNDYSIWDDVVSFMQSHDQKFARENFDTALASFKINSIWVYDTKYERIYSVQDKNSYSLNEVNFGPEFFLKLNKNRTINFFIKTKSGLLEVYGATVHKTIDRNRVEGPYGYLLTGRFIDQKVLTDLSSYINGSVYIGNANNLDLQKKLQSNSSTKTSFIAHKDIIDENGTLIEVLSAEITSVLADQMRTSANNFITASLFFGVSFIAILLALLYIFVSKPLKVLSENVGKKDLTELKYLEKDTSEFGKLALILDQFFTQQMKIEQEKAKTEALLEGIGDGIIGIDRNWNIVFVNRYAREHFGINIENAIGKNLRDNIKLLRARDRKEDITFIEEALLYGKSEATTEEMSILSITGVELQVVVSAAPIFNSLKETVGAVIIIHDASQEIQSRLLRSDFTYASHQLRTPVTEAMWAVNLALEEADMTSKNKDLSIAAQSIKSVHKLVEHLLEVSQIDQKMLIAKPTKIELRVLLESAIETVRNISQSRSILFQVISDQQPALVYADEHLLERTLHELFENVVMYASEKSKVFVSFESQKTQLVIKITNQGRPIPEKELPLLFTKFFRGSNTTKIPGAGLGLYIAREYTHMMNGKIWFTSSAEEGTIFYLSLPKFNSDLEIRKPTPNAIAHVSEFRSQV